MENIVVHVHQGNQVLNRKMQLQIFGATRHPSVFCLICSCFLDVVQTHLGSNRHRSRAFHCLRQFCSKNFGEALLKKAPNLKAI